MRQRMEGTRQHEDELRRREAEIMNLAVIKVTIAADAVVTSNSALFVST